MFRCNSVSGKNYSLLAFASLLNPNQDAIDKKSSLCRRVSEAAKNHLGVDITGIIIHLAGQTYVWHDCKWNFAGPQIYLQPAKIKNQHFGVSSCSLWHGSRVVILKIEKSQ